MLLSKERLLYLLKAWSGHKTAAAEEQELFDWVNENDQRDTILQHIQQLTEQHHSNEETAPVDWEQLYEQILDKSVRPERSAPIRRMPWYKWSVAAAVIISVGAGAYLYFNRSSTKNIVVAKVVPRHVIKDVPAPAKTKAILTLADGSKIELDSSGSGTLAHQGSVQVVKQADGRITYSGASSEVLYNTINVPRGSQVVTIKLSDGTQVWLNSESSLRYPASFTGNERKVEITGEAYFEVAHNPAVPFVVKKDAMEVKVTGTHFNVNTYDDERINKVTLLEGSVVVSTGDQKNMLKPGQQAQVGHAIKLVNGVNIEEVMAWKNGIFQFGEKADLQFIMRKIARWYDVDVEYEGMTTIQHFGGEIPMNSNLSQVLEILRTSGVKFNIEGKKVIVKP